MDFLSKYRSFSLLFLVPLAANPKKVLETFWFWLTSCFSKAFIFRFPRLLLLEGYLRHGYQIS